MAGGVYAPTVPSGYKCKTWRGLAGIGKKRPEDPEYGEYQYRLPYKESDIGAPSDIIAVGDWASYVNYGNIGRFDSRWGMILLMLSILASTRIAL